MAKETKAIAWEEAWYGQPGCFYRPEFPEILDGIGSFAWTFPASDTFSDAASRQPSSHRSAESPRSRQIGKPKSSTPNDAISKRRQQNRMSQIAHRERKKKLVDDLSRQLEECTMQNQALHRTLETMKDMNESMASQIAQILKPHPPKREPLSSPIGSGECFQSPGSCDGGQMMTEDVLVGY